jgi:hypothetical protein
VSPSKSGSCGASLSRRAVLSFEGLHTVFKRPFQYAPADGPEHESEHSSLEVFPVAYDGHINLSRAVGLTREGVDVAGRSSPQVGVSRRKDYTVGIGSVVVQAFPYPA